MSFSLPSENSWALITGASAGIGEVFAKRFACEGWNLVLIARSADKLQALARTLETENRIKTLVLSEDLINREASRKIYEEIKRKEISLDALVNNAGFGVKGKFAEAPLHHYLEMIDLNVRTLVELTGLFLPEMIERKRGLILNVSSTASFQPLAYSTVYAATKAFVTFFTEALWFETQGTGVRVLNLCPGLTKTDFGLTANMGDFRRDPLAQEPEEVVESAFRALKGNAPTVISGWLNKLIVFLERFIPRQILLWLGFLVQQSRGRV